MTLKSQTCLLGVGLDNELKFDDHISSICCKVSAQISALNRFENILPLTTNKSLYRSFILRVLTPVTKSGTTAEKETQNRESQRKGFELHLQR